MATDDSSKYWPLYYSVGPLHKIVPVEHPDIESAYKLVGSFFEAYPEWKTLTGEKN